MDRTVSTRRINWVSVLTVAGAALLIAAEVFGAAYAGGWAIASMFGLGEYGAVALQIIFFLLGLYVMGMFVRFAMRIEPFTTR
jgi:hypothetical protein